MLSVRDKPVRPWLVLASLTFGFFMPMLDETIVNVAITTIQKGLKTDLSLVGWVLSGYSLTFAILLITMGRFADQYGWKRLFLLGMMSFGLGSLGCAFSPIFGNISGIPAIDWLIGFRVLQAVGAAATTATDLPIIIAVFPPQFRGAAIGIWGASAGLAAAIGPVLGGFLLYNFGWPWIFLINLPICATGLVLVTLFVPEKNNIEASKHIDGLGIITLTAAILCLGLAINQGNNWGWNSLPLQSLIGTAFVSLILFVLVELIQREPMIDFRMFKIPSFLGTNVATFLFFIALQGVFLLFVLYFNAVMGYNQLYVAYALMPIPLATFVISVLVGALGDKFNPHMLHFTGLLLIALGFGFMSMLRPHPLYLDIFWRGVLIGVGMGMVFQSQGNLVLTEVPEEKQGVGNGVFNTFQQIGASLGVTFLLSLITGQLHVPLEQASKLQAAHAIQLAWLCTAISAAIGLIPTIFVFMISRHIASQAQQVAVPEEQILLSKTYQQQVQVVGSPTYLQRDSIKSLKLKKYTLLPF